MPEQPQWSERTLDMPPQDPWADPPTTDMPARAHRPGGAPHYEPTRQYAADPGQAAPHSPVDPTRAAPRSPADATRATARPAPDPTRVAQPSAPPAPPSPFSSGRAAVTPRAQPQHFTEHEPTGTGWPGAEPPAQHHPLSWHIAQLRRGGEWSFAGLLFAFVCWGIWAISSDGDLTAPIIVFFVSVLVAGGVFALSRLVGRLVLERQLGRTRRTAKGSHIVAGLFLAGVGIAHLRQTEWVMTAFNWIVDLFR
ncbi:DNA-directed RNA polymerase II [Nucisporomicrobium flavum]|uniref:DNA-directed RNA polymerase II n=1 Tax=Nucisporomicrobium flavum TaxID=2785915 RepID=UPI0018F6259A|nr:DNA-directed RNA polymerase II [Nucisporomicrobium flavum]